MISAEIRLEIFYVTAYMKRVIEVNCVFFGNNWYLHVSNCNLRNSWAFPTELEKNTAGYIIRHSSLYSYDVININK